MASNTATAASFPPYPVIFEIAYPERQSRILALLRLPLLIPLFVFSMVLGIIADVTIFLSWFIVIFAGHYPRWLFNFNVGIARWGAQNMAYQYLMTDRYPAFPGSGNGSHTVRFDVLYPERSSRLTAFFRWFLAMPAVFVFGAFSLFGLVVVPLAWVCIVVAGRQPRGLFEFVHGMGLWNCRLLAYLYLFRDEHPPYSTQPDAPPLSSAAGFFQGVFIIGFVLLVISDVASAFKGSDEDRQREEEEEREREEEEDRDKRRR
jgi:signal transduction histidine kinase